MNLTAKNMRDALAAMPDEAVIHLCVSGLPYLPLVRVVHEPNDPRDGGPGVALVEVDQERLARELGVDGPLRDLLVEIRDNYEPELIAYDNAVEALALLDGVGARARGTTRTIKLPAFGLVIETDGHGTGRIIESKLGDDAIESLILAHACAGVDVTAPAYVGGVKTAIEAVGNHS